MSWAPAEEEVVLNEAWRAMLRSHIDATGDEGDEDETYGSVVDVHSSAVQMLTVSRLFVMTLD